MDVFAEGDLVVGQVFDEAIAVDVPRGENDERPEQIIETMPVTLKLEEIDFFGHPLNKIARGDGALLTLSGNGDNLLEIWNLKRRGISIGLRGGAKSLS